MAHAQQRMIFVLGNICRDTSFYVDRLPLAGETVNATATRVGLGGKGLNQAVAASSAGARVKLVAGIGEDWGEADEKAVQATGCGGLALALIRKSGPLDCSSIIVSDAGENLIVTNAAQAEALSIEDAASLLTFASADVLLIQCNLQPQVTEFAAREARRAGARVIFNPAPLKPWASSLESLADVVVLNAQEASAWTGKADAAEAAAKLNVPLAIITLGAAGCVARRHGAAALRFPAPAAKAVDATGAGDTFAGVFAAEWQATGDDTRAVNLALRAASTSVARPGALASIPSRHHIEELRRSLA
jgi:ribokinase